MKILFWIIIELVNNYTADNFQQKNASDSRGKNDSDWLKNQLPIWRSVRQCRYRLRPKSPIMKMRPPDVRILQITFGVIFASAIIGMLIFLSISACKRAAELREFNAFTSQVYSILHWFYNNKSLVKPYSHLCSIMGEHNYKEPQNNY